MGASFLRRIEFLISPAHSFLLRLRIVERADVNVYRHQVAVAGSDRRGKLSYYPSRFLKNDVVEGTLGAVQSLPEGRAGMVLNPGPGTEKKRGIPEGLDSVEVGLAHADEPDHGCSYLTVTDLRKWMFWQRHRI